MLPYTKLAQLPRMADFALWATACEPMPGSAVTFEMAYNGNRAEAVTSVIEADPVASSVLTLMDERTMWTGTASDLLGALSETVGDAIRKSKSWPIDGRSLSGRLSRAATFLRKIGIEISKQRVGQARTRTITISRADRVGNSASASSAPSAGAANGALFNGLAINPTRTQKPDADAGRTQGGRNGNQSAEAIDRSKSLKSNDMDDADAADAEIPSLLEESVSEESVGVMAKWTG